MAQLLGRYFMCDIELISHDHIIKIKSVGSTSQLLYNYNALKMCVVTCEYN